MTKPVSYTPPDLTLRGTGPVRRRHVFYIPGYDPESRSRYRLLFVRELTLYAKRFGQRKRDIGRASLSPDGLVQSWQVAAHPETDGAETHYDVLLWDDIVARDFARSRFVSAALLLIGTIYALVKGSLFTFYRLNWKYGNIIIYPFVMMVLLGLGAGLVATLIHAGLGDGYGFSLGLPAWVTIPTGIAVGLGLIKAADALLARIYFWQLVNDWVFNWQHGAGWRADYRRRLETFADIVQHRIAMQKQSDRGLPDEIVIVGHSTGGLTAVEVAARLLERDPDLGKDGPTISLVTLGSALPIVAVHPRGRQQRAEIASLVTSQRLVWVDYVAPQDWLNFPGFNPIDELDLGLAPDAVIANPVVRSARFREIINEETYRKVRYRPFRMHFQFLMANDRQGAYDFFAMTLGPRRVFERALETQPDGAVIATAGIEAVAA